jgi:cob(I)alamin adenosyltransferase
MEARIDLLEKDLPKLNSFILPTGTPLASFVHIARANARRVERQAVRLSREQAVPDVILRYLNRISDLLFMLARFINYESGIRDIPWQGNARDRKDR